MARIAHASPRITATVAITSADKKDAEQNANKESDISRSPRAVAIISAPLRVRAAVEAGEGEGGGAGVTGGKGGAGVAARVERADSGAGEG